MTLKFESWVGLGLHHRAWRRCVLHTVLYPTFLSKQSKISHHAKTTAKTTTPSLPSSRRQSLCRVVHYIIEAQSWWWCTTTTWQWQLQCLSLVLYCRDRKRCLSCSRPFQNAKDFKSRQARQQASPPSQGTSQRSKLGRESGSTSADSQPKRTTCSICSGSHGSQRFVDCFGATWGQ